MHVLDTCALSKKKINLCNYYIHPFNIGENKRYNSVCVCIPTNKEIIWHVYVEVIYTCICIKCRRDINKCVYECVCNTNLCA